MPPRCASIKSSDLSDELARQVGFVGEGGVGRLDGGRLGEDASQDRDAARRCRDQGASSCARLAGPRPATYPRPASRPRGAAGSSALGDARGTRREAGRTSTIGRTSPRASDRSPWTRPDAGGPQPAELVLSSCRTQSCSSSLPMGSSSPVKSETAVMSDKMDRSAASRTDSDLACSACRFKIAAPTFAIGRGSKAPFRRARSRLR